MADSIPFGHFWKMNMAFFETKQTILFLIMCMGVESYMREHADALGGQKRALDPQ